MVTIETLKIIKQQRSIRSYIPQQITDEELQAILEAGQTQVTKLGTSLKFRTQFC